MTPILIFLFVNVRTDEVFLLEWQPTQKAYNNTSFIKFMVAAIQGKGLK